MMLYSRWFSIAAVLLLSVHPASAEEVANEVSVKIDVNNRLHAVSPYLAGACIEDVNHEIYGGLYSQMIFGESFQEPSTASPIAGFQVVGGDWRVHDGVLFGGDGDGPKLISESLAVTDGEVSVEMLLPGEQPGNGGFILSTSEAKVGADNFSGYEVSLFADTDQLLIGRHQGDFQPLQWLKHDVPTDQWIRLRVEIKNDLLKVYVDDQLLTEVRDPKPLAAGTIGFRQWKRPAQYRNLTVRQGQEIRSIAFEPAKQIRQVSGMWDAFMDDTVKGTFQLTREQPFVGMQCQRIVHEAGEGVIGIANQGLNRWGMCFRANKLYEGKLWVRTKRPIQFSVGLEHNDGRRQLAKRTIEIMGADDWQSVPFELTPNDDTTAGRFTLKLQKPGQLDVGYVFLQPGRWGRYKDLPVRGDVAQGLIDQGIRVLRYGGSMVDNPPNYRWKNMIGPRDQRQPYDGFWYDYSTNGWGILDFLNFCEAANFLAIPCLSIDETATDMIDLLEYLNGPLERRWGLQRAADGHPQPYRQRHLQLGNEESVNEDYWKRFEPIARALWQRDPGLILIVGDFQYEQPIRDPLNVEGSLGGNRSLATHQKILALAKEYGAEVWFDVHMWTAGPEPSSSMNSFFTFVDAIDQLAAGAKHRVVVFEFNSNHHRQHRALSNAEMIGRIIRDGRIPVALSANCLQPDGQNDNGWDQGLLFLNNSQVWLQPTGYVTQMVSQSYQPWAVQAKLKTSDQDQAPEHLDIAATVSDHNDSVIMRVVNRSGQRQPLSIELPSFSPKHAEANIVSLAGPLASHNTAQQPHRIRPQRAVMKHRLPQSAAQVTVEPYSYTTIEFN